MKNIKKTTILWAKEKALKDMESINIINEPLGSLYNDGDGGFMDEEAQNKIKDLETRRNKILSDREELWQLRSRAIWLATGDENTKLFHNYAKG